MLDGLKNIIRIQEIKKRIFFTAMMLAVYRLGCFIVVPGVNQAKLLAYFSQKSGGWWQFANMFSGGAFARCAIFALGIMPYITSSIIMSLLTTAIPYFEQLAKEGPEGQKKINNITRLGTIIISVVQGAGLAIFMQNLEVVYNPGMGFILQTILTLTTGAVFLMWVGEQITEKGIGNGISLLIFVSIISRIPHAVIGTAKALKFQSIDILPLAFVLLIITAIFVAVVYVESAVRKIPVSYAKQVRGNKMYGGQSTFLPLKVDYAGVIAVIFAASVIQFPQLLAGMLAKYAKIFEVFTTWFAGGTVLWSVTFAVLIIFFCYFYTAVTFNPVDISDNLKKSGGFIPGRRPGKSTAEYINKILIRVTLVGAVFVAVISIIPAYLQRFMHAPFYFGGTSVLIAVGVALDTMKQLESHLVMRHYTGFMKKGKLKGRSGR